MNPASGVKMVLSALDGLQRAEPLGKVVLSCDVLSCVSAMSILRAHDLGAFYQNVSELDIISALIEFKGPIGRRRVLSHLKNAKLINSDVPFYKLMTPGSAPSMKAIVEGVADVHNRKIDEVLGDDRRPENTMARFEAAWIGVRGFGYPVTGMSDAMGKNHTTMLSGVNKVDIMIQRSPIRLDTLLHTANTLDNEAAVRYVERILK